MDIITVSLSYLLLRVILLLVSYTLLKKVFEQLEDKRKQLINLSFTNIYLWIHIVFS